MSVLLERILEIHLHPETGTPYWLERERELGFSLRKRIQCIDDLCELGPFDLQVLHERPLADFIPKGLLHQRRLITGETGGATGAPKTTAFFEEEFQAAFVEPFLVTTGWETPVADGHWLWLGPSGPHIIGKVARQIALVTTGCDGFSVDFDPRWYRVLTEGSLARQRYLDHLVMQAVHILRQQDIRFLFSTPVMLTALVPIMDDASKRAIEFVYLGGMPVGPATLNELGDAFPNARFLTGYGNTLFGVSHEVRPHRPDAELPVYFSPAQRLVLRLVSMNRNTSDSERLRNVVNEGERGQVVMHRLDESCFLANVMERDCGIRVAASGSEGVDGVKDPQPVPDARFRVENGIY